nr:phosphoribosyl-ATP diphosphatase [uncultured Sellimonas sp.]
MSYKRVIPCLFIQKGKAVKWFDDSEILSDNVISLAKQYNNRGADELLVFDLSDSDEEHEETINMIKKINRVIGIPMMAGGNIKRQDDVKKLLYAGTKRVIINFSRPDAVKFMEECFEKFGKEKIAVSLNDFDTLFKQQHVIEKCSSEIVFMHRLDLGSVTTLTQIPYVIVTDTMEESEIFKILSGHGAGGISGRFVSCPELDFTEFKKKCEAKDIRMMYADTKKKRKKPEMELSDIFASVYETIADRKEHPKEGSSTNDLLESGLDRILKKIGEEVTEVLIAAKNSNTEELKDEIVDLLYHLMVLMVEKNLKWDDILKEMDDRH